MCTMKGNAKLCDLRMCACGGGGGGWGGGGHLLLKNTAENTTPTPRLVTEREIYFIS